MHARKHVPAHVHTHSHMEAPSLTSSVAFPGLVLPGALTYDQLRGSSISCDCPSSLLREALWQRLDLSCPPVSLAPSTEPGQYISVSKCERTRAWRPVMGGGDEEGRGGSDRAVLARELWLLLSRGPRPRQAAPLKQSPHL